MMAELSMFVRHPLAYLAVEGSAFCSSASASIPNSSRRRRRPQSDFPKIQVLCELARRLALNTTMAVVGGARARDPFREDFPLYMRSALDERARSTAITIQFDLDPHSMQRRTTCTGEHASSAIGPKTCRPRQLPQGHPAESPSPALLVLLDTLPLTTFDVMRDQASPTDHPIARRGPSLHRRPAEPAIRIPRPSKLSPRAGPLKMSAYRSQSLRLPKPGRSWSRRAPSHLHQ